MATEKINLLISNFRNQVTQLESQLTALQGDKAASADYKANTATKLFESLQHHQQTFQSEAQRLLRSSGQTENLGKKLADQQNQQNKGLDEARASYFEQGGE